MENLESRGLSPATCRRLLGASADDLSDAQVEQLRAQLYALAGCVVDAAVQDSTDKCEATVLRLVPENERDAVEERAGMLQFDAGMTRSAATRAALAVYVGSVKGKGRGAGVS